MAARGRSGRGLGGRDSGIYVDLTTICLIFDKKLLSPKRELCILPELTREWVPVPNVSECLRDDSSAKAGALAIDEVVGSCC